MMPALCGLHEARKLGVPTDRAGSQGSRPVLLDRHCRLRRRAVVGRLAIETRRGLDGRLRSPADNSGSQCLAHGPSTARGLFARTALAVDPRTDFAAGLSRHGSGRPADHGDGIGPRTAAAWRPRAGWPSAARAVTVTDLADRASARRFDRGAWPTSQIARWRLGGHEASRFFIRRRGGGQSGSAARSSPAGSRPGRRGTITSEIELFLDRCPATVVGVTGSNGKSSTATMLAAMLQAAGRAAVAGWQHRQQPAAGARRDSAGRRRGAGAEQFSARPFEPSGAVSRGRDRDRLHAQPSRLARHVCRPMRRPNAGWSNLAGRRAGGRQPGRSRIVVVARSRRGQQIAPWPLERVPESGGGRRASADERRAWRRRWPKRWVPSQRDRPALAAFVGLPHRQESAGSVAGRHFIDDSNRPRPRPRWRRWPPAPVRLGC